MNKKIIILLVVALSFGLSSYTLKNDKLSEETTNNETFAVTLRYYNKDSKSYEFKVKTCGSTKEVEFGSSRTATVTIQSGCSDAVIFDECGEKKVENGDKITIKNGCISIN